MVRDLIFGVMDFEVITSLATHEITEAVPDYEDFMRSLERMILVKHSEIPPVDKKQRILLAGVQVFAEKGYTDATISEIASLANVADGTVYEYYKSKEDLLLSTCKEHFQDHLHQLKELLTFTIQ